MKIALIGTGVYGLAMAMMLNKKTNDLIMWTESKERYQNYLKYGCIKNVIPNIEAPKNIKLTMSYEECLKDAEIVKVRKEGTKNYYYFDPEMKMLEQLIDTLQLARDITIQLPDRSGDKE